jgi:hypothetical protein
MVWHRDTTRMRLFPASHDSGFHLRSGNMYLDHPVITATHSLTEPDRIERLNRVYGYMVGLADNVGDKIFIKKLAQLHDDKGTMVVFWNQELTPEEKQYCVKAWQSLVGDGSANVEFSLFPPPPIVKLVTPAPSAK